MIDEKPAGQNRGFFIFGNLMRLFLFAIPLFLIACGSPPKELQKKLQDIGNADLEIIVKGLPEQARKEALLPKPYFVVDTYKEFQGDTARMFQAYAVLAFFYLDPSLDLCQIRKYRYRRSARVWERFDVVLRHIPAKYVDGEESDSSGTAEKP
ncbi:MAG TPA: hypothetical protein DCQ83_07140 [Fibrobacteres bacterium]|mgnify:CR=1 FL=1|nr:hypothetical protein [Fibrobacterota bacterium]